MKNTTLRQLVVFETVAKHLHFTRAAKEQMGKRIHLTEAGRELLRSTREISRHLAEAESSLDRLKGVQGGRLRLAIAPTAKYFIPKILAEFVRQHPGVVVDLLIASRDELLLQLEDNARDMIVMTSPPADTALITESFLADPLVAIAPPDHPLAGVPAVPLDRLADEGFLLRENGSETRRLLEQFFHERSLTLSTIMEVNSNEAIKQAVMAGFGVAVVPLQSIVAERDTSRLAVLDIVTLPLQVSWHLVNRREKRFSCVAVDFRSFVLQYAGNHIATDCVQPAQSVRRQGATLKATK